MSIEQKNNLLKSNASADTQQIQQRLWVREQEINALKVQNRHLLTKLDDAEKSAKPNQINTQGIAEEVQKNLKPVLAEMEASLKSAFDILQSTMRGIYQQSSRAQEAVDEMTRHTRDIQNQMQDNVTATMTTFCDRLERQILSRLNGVDILVQKQNEMLRDIETMKVAFASMQSRSENGSAEASQRLVEVQIQSRNSEEVTRDALQQIRNHRSEFKILRAEVRTLLENSRSAVNGDSSDLEVSENAPLDASGEDMTRVLELLRNQKSDLQKVAKDSENFLKNAQSAPNLDADARVGDEEIRYTDLNT